MHDNNEKSPSYLGKIELSDIGEVDIYTISNDDGNIPHFYIENNNFKSSICIFDNKYYGDGDRLNNNQLHELNTYLADNYSNFIFGIQSISNWEELIAMYFSGNEDENIYSKIQPDYISMEESIYE